MKKLFFFAICLILACNIHTFAQCNAQYNWSAAQGQNNLLGVGFNNLSNTGALSQGSYFIGYIYYGDGTSNYIENSSFHNYANPGVYNTMLVSQIADSSTNSILCADTAYQQVTINYLPCAQAISTLNNNGGSYTFTAINLANTLSITYSWDFGDGSPTASGSSVSHTYAVGGNFLVTLTSSGNSCTYTTSNTISNFSGSMFNCNNATADFTTSTNNNAAYFTNISSDNQNIPVVFYGSDWDFGDGSTYSNSSSWINESASHTYTSIGTYNVTLVNKWIDSNQVFCSKTVIHTVNINTVFIPNIIRGYIFADTLPSGNPNNYKVWLIKHDAANSTLTAVDSLELPGNWNTYQFQDLPPGDYLVKAAVQGQTPGVQGWLPTYHDASVYWSGANTIAHTGGFSANKNIHMQNGTVTSGPGFIGGNISQGAGRGTGTGIQGMLVYLRNSNNQLITAAVTDADGNYSFSNIPTGVYSVYPEAINYNTTSYNTINVTTSQSSVSAIDFERTADEIKPKNATTGITKVGEKDRLKIYPNPAKNQINIESQNGQFNQVKIMNAVGQLIKESSLNNGINKVDISEMNAGIYYLLISGNEGSRSMKMVKQ